MKTCRRFDQSAPHSNYFAHLSGLASNRAVCSSFLQMAQRRHLSSIFPELLPIAGECAQSEHLGAQTEPIAEQNHCEEKCVCISGFEFRVK
jgi:hypothetical protein